MTSFKKFSDVVATQFNNMAKNNDRLFVVDISKEELWGTYLDSFPDGENEIYKERRAYDCNHCKQFIRPFAGVVAIDTETNELISIWDVTAEYPFNIVAEKMATLVKSASVKNVFFTETTKLGTVKNVVLEEDKTTTTWHHFHANVPKSYVKTRGKSIEAMCGPYKASKDVFKRSMEELTIDAGETFVDLIQQGSIYRGEEHLKNIEAFLLYKRKFDAVEEESRDAWCWVNSINNPVSRIRNTAAGTLLIDLSEGVELDEAVRKFEKVMAPTNYKRPKALFTKKMIEDAENTLVELGLESSLKRKYATLEDITVNNVLFVNRDAKKKIGGSVFDELKEEVAINPKKYNKVEEVSIDDFVEKVLPTASNVELLLETRHKNNLMSLVGPADKEAPSILKWDNNFSWSYTGDLADSMKQNVKNAGGSVDGALRFSLQWNEDGITTDDYDAHCREPGGHIYFRNKVIGSTGGNLDVDNTSPGKKVAVENITWPSLDKMKDGIYEFWVHNYSRRGNGTGFTAELEYDGQIYFYEYPIHLLQDQNVPVVKFKFSKATGIEFISSMDSTTSSIDLWNVKTNNFVSVSTFMYSPNYWDGQEGIGPKHFFFFLDGCKNEASARGFYNENLQEALTPHRKVFEALGSRMVAPFDEHQLSGVGFNSTVRNDVVVRVSGSFTRVMKIKF